MNQRLQQRLQNQLGPDERLLWSGAPRDGIHLQANDVFMIPFSLMWGGFTFFWEYMALQQNAPGFFAIWGIPFVLIGVYLIVGRFFYEAARRGRTIYGVTNQRVLIVSEFPTTKVESLVMASVDQIRRVENADRSGTLTLGKNPGLYNWLAGTGWPGISKYLPPQLEMIQNVREVENRIMEAQKDARRALPEQL